MRHAMFYRLAAAALGLLLYAAPAGAIESFCPSDTNGDGFSDDPNVQCIHLGAGDGMSMMADGHPQYIFGFTDVTGVPDADVMSYAMLGANLPSPTIELKEGQEFYLTLSNYGMMMRPDLFDPHTVHWHGFPQAISYYDGVPDLSISINMGGSLTYFYIANDPGTYMYHCHVEATEHIEMGMIAHLFVHPAQDGQSFDDPTDSVLKTFTKFAYNDGDGTTGYDVEKAIQLADFDRNFHDQHIAVQPLPFAALEGDYFMMNGRGYPDTVSASPVLNESGYAAQNQDALVEVTQGQRALLRFTNLSVDSFFTIESLGIPMKVVGQDAKILRGPTGADLMYKTNSITFGGGQTYDVLIDTMGVPTGTYYIFSRNLYALNNFDDRRGGMMTQIVVNP